MESAREIWEDLHYYMSITVQVQELEQERNY